MQHACEDLLADTTLAEKQHRGMGRRDPLHHVQHGVEARRDADGLRGFRRVGAGQHGIACGRHRRPQRITAQGCGHQVLQVRNGLVAPCLDRLADDAASGLAHRLALDFAVEDLTPHELGGVTRRIADLHPARWFGADREVPGMLFVFDLVRPEELAVVFALFDVELQPHRLGQADAFQAVHLRPDDEHVFQRRLGPHLARHLRVISAGLVAHAGEQAACHVHAQALDHLASQRAQRLRVDQQHALLIHPDAAVAGRKAQARHQVGKVREADLVDVGEIGVEQRLARDAG